MFLPRESHGQKSLVGYSPWGCKEPDTTDWHFHFMSSLVWEASSAEPGMPSCSSINSTLSPPETQLPNCTLVGVIWEMARYQESGTGTCTLYLLNGDSQERVPASLYQECFCIFWARLSHLEDTGGRAMPGTCRKMCWCCRPQLLVRTTLGTLGTPVPRAHPKMLVSLRCSPIQQCWECPGRGWEAGRTEHCAFFCSCSPTGVTQ